VGCFLNTGDRTCPLPCAPKRVAHVQHERANRLSQPRLRDSHGSRNELCKVKILSSGVFSWSFSVFISFEMVDVASDVNTEFLLVLPHLLTPSEVLNKFQKSENGCNIDTVCTL